MKRMNNRVLYSLRGAGRRWLVQLARYAPNLQLTQGSEVSRSGNTVEKTF
jgi:hypothetical protein